MSDVRYDEKQIKSYIHCFNSIINASPASTNTLKNQEQQKKAIDYILQLFKHAAETGKDTALFLPPGSGIIQTIRAMDSYSSEFPLHREMEKQELPFEAGAQYWGVIKKSAAWVLPKTNTAQTDSKYANRIKSATKLEITTGGILAPLP